MKLGLSAMVFFSQINFYNFIALDDQNDASFILDGNYIKGVRIDEKDFIFENENLEFTGNNINLLKLRDNKIRYDETDIFNVSIDKDIIKIEDSLLKEPTKRNIFKPDSPKASPIYLTDANFNK